MPRRNLFTSLIVLLCGATGGAWAVEAVGQVNAYPPLSRLTPQPSGPSAQVLELDGVWEFNPAPKARPQDWKPIKVPGQWLQQGFAKTEPEVVYRRRMAVPVGWQGQRIKLRFDAVYAESEVFLNGKKIGEHNVGYTPFECDATAAARMGAADNLLEVRVRSMQTGADQAQGGCSYACHDLGGIVRSVRAFAVPLVNLASFHVRTELDLATGQARLLVDLKIANEGAIPGVPEQLRLELRDPAGQPVALTPVAPPLKELAAGEVEPLTLSYPVNQPLLWNAEHPHLYRLMVQLGQQAATRRVGFRSISMKDGQLLVNGRVVKLAGVCRWDIHYLRGRSLPTGMGREDVRLFKEANINYLRTSHCPPVEEVLEACDELGMYVLEEAPAAWRGRTQLAEDKIAKTDAAIVAGTLDMLERDRSHPSVIAWSLSNESHWLPVFKTTAALVKHYDPTRPRLMAGNYLEGMKLGFLDISTWHYPSPDVILKWQSMPKLFTEYAHIGRHNQREKISDPGVLDLYGEDFAATWDAVLKANHVGGSIWAGLDEVFQLSGGRIKGYGRWGLLDEFRRPKPEYWHVKKVYSPIHITARTLTSATDGTLHVPVSNRYVFTDLKELKWSCPEGSVEVALPPGTSGELIIRPRSADVRRVTLEAWHPAGWLVDGFTFDLAARSPIVAQAVSTVAPKLEEQPDRWVISAGATCWTVDRKSGLIVQGQRNQTTIISGGPHLVATLPEGIKKCKIMDPEEILPLPAVFSPPVKSTAVRQEAGCVIVERAVENEAVSGTIRFAMAGDGSLTAEYELKWKPSTEPTQADRTMRELGLAFDLVPACDRLSWRRIGQWSYYPEDHIGRETGSCRAFPSGQRPAAFFYTPQNPKLPWSQDETPWGCNDFRSTKHNILEAALTSPEGAGVRVLSDGRQHVRATVEDERTIRLFINDFSGFGNRSFRKDRKGAYLNLVTNPDQKGHVSIVLVDNKEARVENDPGRCGWCRR